MGFSNRLKYIRDEYDSNSFEFRFKRKPKMWTIEEVHDLWIRSTERAVERKKPTSEAYNKIIKEIPKVGNHRKVYFIEDGVVFVYEFSWSNTFKSYAYSTNRVKFSDNKKIARDEKIEFILSNERSFELGEEYRQAQKLQCTLQRRVFSIMCEMTESKLRAHYKDKIIPPNITKVKIGDIEYYFMNEKGEYYGYPKFKFMGKVSDSSIKL